MADRSPFPVTLEASRKLLRHDATANWINYHLELLSKERVLAFMTVEPKHLSPLGILHAAMITAFADITCGSGTMLYLPGALHTFATLEIKTNFISSVKDGKLVCESVPRHAGGHTHVWDATVAREDTGKTVALFRCTQMILERHSPESR